MPALKSKQRYLFKLPKIKETPNAIKTDIAFCLKRIRKRQKITLLELSKKSGISKGLLSKIENDINKNPTINTLLKIAEALSTDLEHLIYKHLNIL